MSAHSLLALLPLLVLFLGSVAVLFLPQRGALVFGAGCALLAAVCACWPGAPTLSGTTLLAITPFTRACMVLWSLLGAATCLLAEPYRTRCRLPSPEFAALILCAVLGMALLSAGNSLVSLFLGLETMTLAFYVLVAFDRENPTGAEAGLKYLLPGLLASALLAFGIALVYAAAGTFALPEALFLPIAGTPLRSVALLGWAMILAAVSFKTSLVPFHLWTPDVYQGAPAPVSGLLASGSKGAVFAVLLGAAPLAVVGPLRLLMLVLAVLSMIVGTLAALAQTNLKRMLAYSSVVHMGYLVMAVLAGSQSGVEAGFFYLIVYGMATIAAFGIVASMSDLHNEPQDYAALEGLGRRAPWRAGLLTGVLLSLAGLPPLAGFMGKFVLFGAALQAGYLWLVVLGLLSSLISCYYYFRPIFRMYGVSSEGRTVPAPQIGERLVLGACAVILLLGGLYPEPLFRLLAAVLP